jgi:hypothetical protein
LGFHLGVLGFELGNFGFHLRDFLAHLLQNVAINTRQFVSNKRHRSTEHEQLHLVLFCFFASKEGLSAVL